MTIQKIGQQTNLIYLHFCLWRSGRIICIFCILQIVIKFLHYNYNSVMKFPFFLLCKLIDWFGGWFVLFGKLLTSAYWSSLHFKCQYMHMRGFCVYTKCTRSVKGIKIKFQKTAPNDWYNLQTHLFKTLYLESKSSVICK